MGVDLGSLYGKVDLAGVVASTVDLEKVQIQVCARQGGETRGEKKSGRTVLIYIHYFLVLKVLKIAGSMFLVGK